MKYLFRAGLAGDFSEVEEGFPEFKSHELHWFPLLMAIYCSFDRIISLLERFPVSDIRYEQPGSFTALAHEFSVDGIFQVFQAYIV